MTLSASDTPVKVEILENGTRGEDGADGADGSGFNNIRKTLIDNPLCWLYKKNNLVNILNQALIVDRPNIGNYTDIYGQAQVAAIDEPREELKGWLIDDTETHTFNVLNNIPDLDNDFSVVVNVGSYAENTTEENVFVVPATSGNLLSLSTNGSGNWVAILQGSDDILYSAVTTVNANSALTKIIILEYVTDTLNIYINNVLSGSITLPTGITKAMDLDGVVTLSGDYDVNMQGLRFYPFIFNSDERVYINE